MTIADGFVIGSIKIVDHGPPNKLLNIVLISEGYTSAQMSLFASDANKFVNKLFSTSPFDEFKCAINIFRVDVASTMSGADDPATCGDGTTGSGATVTTYFDASFCDWGVRRNLRVDEGSVKNVVDRFVRQWHLILVIINSTLRKGGTGGSIAKTSVAPGWENVAIHEMGHTLFGLADEYDCYSCAANETGHDSYRGLFAFEPAEFNITTDSNNTSNKWPDLIVSSTPLPTTSNSDCTE
jgi:IgA Peptidase M64